MGLYVGKSCLLRYEAWRGSEGWGAGDRLRLWCEVCGERERRLERDVYILALSGLRDLGIAMQVGISLRRTSRCLERALSLDWTAEAED